MIYQLRQKYFTLLLSVAIFYSCDVKDNFINDCYKPYLLQVLVSSDANDDFHPEHFAPNDISLMKAPTKALIYIFSKDMIYLGTHQANIGELVELPYELNEIHAIAIGTDNSVNIKDVFPTFVLGEKYSDTDVLYSLSPILNSASTAQSPIDFMYANDNFPINPHNDKNIIYSLYIEPKIGAVKITTQNLPLWANNKFGNSGLTKDEFSFLVGTTLDQYSLAGVLMGEQTNYQPEVLYVSDTEIDTPMFNLMPTSNNKRLRISIYRNGKPIYTISTTSYIIDPRAPYIINLNFQLVPDSPDISLTPSEFENVYINRHF